MNIKNMLYQPSLMKLKESYHELRRNIGYENSEEAVQLVEYVNSQLLQIEELLRDLGSQKRSAEHAQAYRNLKLELRFAQRRWQRMTATENRFRKIHEKGHDVSTFAA